MTETAVVTGASSGIGAATVHKLVQDGYRVVAAARRYERLVELATATGALPAQLDVTDDVSVGRLAATLERCDVVVHCAGGALGAEPVAEADPEDWLASFEVNTVGTLRVTQALLPLLRAAGRATIVTITSTAGYVNYEGGGGYSAAKHAQHALTETLRLELCGEPIRVVEIMPGMVATEEFALNRYRGDAAKAAAVYQGVDRPLVAEDVAECVSWALALPEHVNVDRLVVRPLAQGAQHKVHRGPLFAGRARA